MIERAHTRRERVVAEAADDRDVRPPSRRTSKLTVGAADGALEREGARNKRPFLKSHTPPMAKTDPATVWGTFPGAVQTYYGAVNAAGMTAFERLVRAAPGYSNRLGQPLFVIPAATKGSIADNAPGSGGRGLRRPRQPHGREPAQLRCPSSSCGRPPNRSASPKPAGGHSRLFDYVRSLNATPGGGHTRIT